MTSFGPYDLLALLAKGGLAEIWLARQRGLAGFEKLVVVKRLHERLKHDPEYVDMFLDEARINARLSHRNVLQVYELGEVDGSYFLAMEYVEGLPLGVLAHRAVSRLGDLPIAIASALIVQAANGLHYAHEAASTKGEPLHIVHRDVSPLNLLVSWDGILKIADFGIAKAEGRRTRTKSGIIKGTPTYMAPEQCTGEEVDRRADVFALGILLWELITGRRLFKRANVEDIYDAIVQGRVPPPSSYRVELSINFDALTLRALSRRPVDRFQSAGELASALESLLHKEGMRAATADVQNFLGDHFRLERAEQETLLNLVRSGSVNADEPLFIKAEHGLDSGEGGEMAPSIDLGDMSDEGGAGLEVFADGATDPARSEPPSFTPETMIDAAVVARRAELATSIDMPAATSIDAPVATAIDSPAITATTETALGAPTAIDMPAVPPPTEGPLAEPPPTLDERPKPATTTATRSPPTARTWPLVLIAFVAVLLAAAVGLLAGRWSVHH